MRVDIKDVNTARNLLSSLEIFQIETREVYNSFMREYDESCNTITDIHNSITSDFESASQNLEQAFKDVEAAERSLSECQATECEETTIDEEGNETTTTVTPDCSIEESTIRGASYAFESAQDSYNKAKARHEASSEVYNKLVNLSENMESVQNSYKSILNSAPISYERLKFAVDVFERALAVKFSDQTNPTNYNKYLRARVSNAFLNYSSKDKQESEKFKIDVEIQKEESYRKSEIKAIIGFIKGNLFEKEFKNWCETNNILYRKRTMDTYINENFDSNDEYSEEVIYTEQKNVLDFYLKDQKSIWEIKSGYENSQIEWKQMDTYKGLLELGYFYRDKKDDKTKYELKEVNYLFKTKEGLLNNMGHLRGTGIVGWYMDETDTPKLYND